MQIETLNLKKFEDYGSKISRKISINRSFGFGFPPAFYKEQGIEEYSHLQLFYDEGQKVIGLCFVQNPEEHGGFAILKYGDKDKYGANCIARSFFNKYAIDVNVYYGKYDFEKIHMENIGNVYLIQLKRKEIIKI